MVRRITRKEYMANSSELFDEYYLQLATATAEQQILNTIGLDALLASEDKHLNDVKLPFNNMGSGGGWWWDTIIIRRELLAELGEVDSPCTRTCVGKAIARQLIDEAS